VNSSDILDRRCFTVRVTWHFVRDTALVARCQRIIALCSLLLFCATATAVTTDFQQWEDVESRITFNPSRDGVELWHTSDGGGWFHPVSQPVALAISNHLHVNKFTFLQALHKTLQLLLLV
jgi:hypothetical protein